MAKRYSGDIELRIACKPYRGWNGKKALFYFASIRAPGHRGRGILSPRECGIWLPWGLKSPEAYDKAARAFITLAHEKHGIGRYASFVGPRGHEKLEILRVQQAPCPTGMTGSPARCSRKLTRKRRRNA